MQTIDTIESRPQHYIDPVNVVMNDNGWFYIKQGMDWVCLPMEYLGDLTDALIKLQGHAAKKEGN